jgi:DNA-binding transcriptional LysR family regulator
MKLFYREKNKMRLTESGQLLKSKAEEIVFLSDRMEQEFLNRKETVLDGTIMIGCVEADNSDTIAMFLEEMIRQYPNVHFSIFSGTSDTIIERLDKGLLDIALLLEPISAEKYEKIIFPRKERWGLLVSSESLLAEKTTISVNELIDIPLLCSSRLEIQTMIQSWLPLENQKLNIVGTFNLIFNVFSLVENKVGSALTIEGAITNRKNENMKFLPIIPEIQTNCVLIWKKNNLLTPTIYNFIDRIKKAFES